MLLSDADAAELERLEQTLLCPEVRRSRDAMRPLLAEDFVEIGASGRVYDKAAILDMVERSFEGQLTLHNFRARALAPTVALVQYDGRLTRAQGNETHSRRASVWRRTGAGWEIVFHQGTLLAPEPEACGVAPGP